MAETLLAALGGTAALTEIIRAAKDLVTICKSFKDAPKEIQETADECQLLVVSIERFLCLTRRFREIDHSTEEDSDLFKNYVVKAQTAVNQTKFEFRRELQAPSFRGRVRWCIWGKEKVDFLLSRLLRIQSSLSATMQLVFMKIDSSRFNRLEDKLDLLLSYCQQNEKNGVNKHVRNVQHQISPSAAKTLLCAADPITLLLQPWCTAQIRAELEAAHVHEGAVLFGQVPNFKSSSALKTNFMNFLLEAETPQLSVPTPTLASYQSNIMEAAAQGDSSRLDQLLSINPGLQYSCTVDGLTPICFAIESGSTETVQLLLDHDVNVNSTFGKYRSTPLAVALQTRSAAITKLLISAGASLNQRNRYGGSPIFHLWKEKHPSQSSVTELLSILHSHADFNQLHQGVYDSSGWSVMHHASAFGTAEDVSQLIKYGLNPFEVIKRPKKKDRREFEYDGWSVIQLVVYYGNLHTFKVLLPFYIQEFGHADLADRRGWTLLHIAVERGHLSIAKVLLEYGADHGTVTRPTDSGIPGDAKSHRYTPFTLAYEAGREYFEQFYAIVRSTQRALPECMGHFNGVSLVRRTKNGRSLRRASNQRADQGFIHDCTVRQTRDENATQGADRRPKNEEGQHRSVEYKYLSRQAFARVTPQLVGHDSKSCTQRDLNYCQVVQATSKVTIQRLTTQRTHKREKHREDLLAPG